VKESYPIPYTVLHHQQIFDLEELKDLQIDSTYVMYINQG